MGYLAVVAMGLVLGLIGGGGSILTVPILVYIFKIDAVLATAYSLFIVGLAASVGAYKNYRSGYVNVFLALSFSLPGFLGVFLSRSILIPNLPEFMSLGGMILSKGNLIMLVFSLMMILASYSMIFGRKEPVTQNAPPNNLFFNVTLGFNVGVITGFIGAGGGFIIIPVLMSLCGLNMKMAVGTSLLIITINSLLGFLGDALLSSIEWSFLFKLSFLAILGIIMGSNLSQKVPGPILKKGFGFFILILGLIILYQKLSVI